MAPAAPLVSERLCGDLQQPITALAWRPDGRHLAAGDANGRWWWWPVSVPVREREPGSAGSGFG